MNVDSTATDSPTNHEPRPGRRASLVVPVLVALVIGVVYPFSYGPVMRLQSRGHLVRFWPVLDVVYSPMEWVQQTGLGAEIVGWYLDLWGA